MRPFTEVDVKAAYNVVAPIAVGIVNDGEECAPQVAVIKFHDKKVGEIDKIAYLDPKLVAMLMRDPESARLLNVMVRDLLRADFQGKPLPGKFRQMMFDRGIRPDAVVQVNEAWTAPEVPEGHPNWAKQPSQRDDKRDSLMILVHVREHTYGQAMHIQHDEAGKRSVKLAQINFGEPGNARDDISQGVMAGGRMSIQEPDEETVTAIRRAGFSP